MSTSITKHYAKMAPIETRHGKFFIPDRNDLIANSLREYGEWAEAELRILCDFLSPGDVVIDGGACFGTHARAFSAKVGRIGKVICFEPNPTNRAFLERNAAIAVLKNIDVHALALGSTETTGTLNDADSNNAGASSITEMKNGGLIRIARLDSIVNTPVQFIKLDLEGSELAALLGSRRILDSYNPTIFIELLDLDSAAPIFNLLKSLDYLAYGLSVSAFQEENFRGSLVNIFGAATECGILFIHSKKLNIFDNPIKEHNLSLLKTLDDIAFLITQQPQYIEKWQDKRTSAQNTSILTLENAVKELKGEISASSAEVAFLTTRIVAADATISDLNRRLKIEEGISAIQKDGLEKAASLLRKSFSVRLQRNAAKAALENFHWLSARQREKLQRSVEKREYRHLVDLAVEPFISAVEAPVTPTEAPDSLLVGVRSKSFGCVPRAIAPSTTDWDKLTANGGFVAEKPYIDVIVPVYQGFDETMRCLYSVISEPQKTPFRIVVVNDNPTDRQLGEALRSLEARGWIDLYVNKENLGFVSSCNFAMRLNHDRDVILLNSDTEVYSDWLDRIWNFSQKNQWAGSLTPFSNNATICSYPRFFADNDEALEVDGRALDAMAANCFSNTDDNEAIMLPTGVGFCMYLRRTALNQVGLFNEEVFGKGYGEENDLSMRLYEAGWTNLLVPNVYVRHWGGVSFSSEANPRKNAATVNLDLLHPSYNRTVTDFIKLDPIRQLRARLDIARVFKRSQGNGILYITHDWGGGIEAHVESMRLWLERETAVSVFVCRPHPDIEAGFFIEDPESGVLPNLPFGSWLDDSSVLENYLKSLGIGHIHIHSLVNHGRNARNVLKQIAERGILRVDYTVHDYFSICPRIHLIDKTGLYCGEPDLSQCQKCVDQGGVAAKEPIFMQSWRREHLALLNSVSTVFAPSNDVARRIRSYSGREDITVREHATEEFLVDALKKVLKIEAREC